MRLVVENKSYSKKEILSVDPNSIDEEYLKEIFVFLHNWWNEDDYIIAKTSGSTGLPKDIILTKKAMRISAEATGIYFSFPKKICSPLSAKFIAGKMMLVRAIEWDAEIHFLRPNTNPLELILEQYDFMVMTPHQLSIGLEKGLEDRLGYLEQLLLGGSPVDKKLEMKIESLKTPIFLGYGMTETMSHVALRQLNGKNLSKKYLAVEGISFDVDDRACLIIQSKELLKELLITNDVVDLIDQSSFIWKSRFDNVINSGGLKIYPEEIEKKIEDVVPFPFYVAGKIHEEFGQQLTLYVESDALTNSYKNNLLVKLKNILPKFHNPREIIEVKQFEYTKNGKRKRIIY